MAKNLVIVESPAKAKTIEKFLGPDFKVVSSYGHVSDLPDKELGVDVEQNFTPKYTVSSDKKKIVSELKSLAKKSNTVWLASDEDREGEAIAWHLSNVLELQKENTKRIVFNEITKTALALLTDHLEPYATVWVIIHNLQADLKHVLLVEHRLNFDRFVSGAQ